MRIYSMTATFGKLEHETLTLKSGVNIIEAPNEWGKSTWCAFLVNMLYGLDTRARTTKTELADKERYAPWSGAPMSGSIDLNWNGRDITIQRQTKGRLIFGEFRAFETATGLDVPELNGSNCGQILLGVERSVFTRAGFLKLTDLPVTQDDALRRRLNNLVTTGDESGAGDRLQSQLKDLKNKCRFNRSGLLPQAEAQKSQLEGQIAELEQLEAQSQTLHQRHQALNDRIAVLENHKAALRYAAAQEDTARVGQALAAQKAAQEKADILKDACQALPSRQEAEEAVAEGKALQKALGSLQMENSMLPPLPPAPAHYEPGRAALLLKQAEEDFSQYTRLQEKKKKQNRLVLLLFFLAAAVLTGLALCHWVFSLPMGLALPIGGGAAAAGLIFLLIFCILRTRKHYAAVEAVFDRHPGLSPDRWIPDAQGYDGLCRAYERELAHAQALRGDLDSRTASLKEAVCSYSGDQSLEDRLDWWRNAAAQWDSLADATRELRQAEHHAQALQAMAKTAQPPAFADLMTETEAETDGYLTSARLELRQVQQKLDQSQGRAQALGQMQALRSKLSSVNRRIHKLEDTYAALEIAQRALTAATAQLQRRFAPRISKRAQELFSRLTGGRYVRLTLSDDLSVNTAAQCEDTLRLGIWRSDGTVDQLYLALRLAVAEELTPDAPLILDDALVRFDDHRLAQAMDILREMGQHKQVILFTCQKREGAVYERM